MTNYRDYDKDVMRPHGYHAGRWVGPPELEPVGGKPELPHGFAENFDGDSTPTKGAPWATLGMVNDALRRVGDPQGLIAVRIASDRRIYLLGALSVTLGLLVMLGTIGLYLYRPTPSHVTLDNWCDRFRGALSCPGAENGAGKHN